MKTKSRLITAVVVLAAMLLALFPQGSQVVEASPDDTTYNFSTGAGTNKWAWQELEKHTDPSDNDYEADATAYSNIASSNDLRWTTDYASGDGYDSQMYKFTITETPSSISQITVNWEGYGDGEAGYDTTLDIWNYNTLAWEQLDTQDDMGSDGPLTGTAATAATNYISGGELTVRAVAKNYEAGGCPYLYGWNGESYKFIGETLSSSFLKRYEATSYARTTSLEPKDGYYDLMIHAGLPETTYVNNLGLWAVDHPEGTEVIPDPLGTVHTISNPLPVAAVDKDGNDATSLLAHQDGEYWKSDLTGKDFSNESDLVDYIELTLPEGPETGIAKLVVDVRETPLGELVAWYYLHFILGTPNLDYLLDRLENDPEFAGNFDLAAWRTLGLAVQCWNGSAWVDYSGIPTVSMFFKRPAVIPIDLSETEGNQIRLLMPIGMHEIDYVAVDYTADEAVSITPLAPVEATEHFLGGSTADALGEITTVDDSYAVMERGDYINYKFPALAPPPDGLQRSFVFPVGGYFYLIGPEVPQDKMGNLPLLEDFTYIPYAPAKWMLPRYIHPEDYPYSEYFHLTNLKPPFATDLHNSLNTDYVEVVVTYTLEGDYGDAPEDALAYPPAATIGQFPTCITPGPATWIYHAPEPIAFFGMFVDPEVDGNAGTCTFPPYDQDECCINDLMGPDAGLIFPGAYTIVGPAGSESIIPCPGDPMAGMPLGVTCQTAVWGANVDILIDNLAGPPAFVNVLMDWDQNGAWDGFSTTCPPAGVPVAEHVLVNFFVPPGYIGPLSGLGPPAFQIGPNDGYVWTRFTISEDWLPVEPDLWDGSGIFDYGETEDYLLRVLGPEIHITKDGLPNPIEAGQTITYTYEVTNGNNGIPITGVTVDDDNVACSPPSGPAYTVGDTDATLEDGEVWTYTCDYVTTMADLFAGSVDNEATASGTGPAAIPVQDTAEETVNVDPPTAEDNPALEESCGLDVVLALDMSGSINSALAEDEVKDAAKKFVDALLPATPSLIGLVEFSSGDASVVLDLTDNAGDLKSNSIGIDSLTAWPSGYTNWEKALLLATGLLENDPEDRDDTEHPDLIIIITDGEPTTSESGWGGTSNPSHLYAAILAANAAKLSTSTGPIRILAVGIDPTGTSTLEDISGSNVADDYGEASADTDVVTGVLPEADPDILDLAEDMGDVLKDLANVCLGTLEVVKDLVPSDDPGLFNLQIDGVTKYTDASDGDTTGKQTVNTGTHTVGEIAGTDTDLNDYGTCIECKDADQNPVTATQVNGTTWSVDVNEGDDIVCTITNTRDTGKLEVVKDLDPSDDPGLFNLQIDGVTKYTDASDGDTTGKQTVNTGTHTVGEVAGTDTDLNDYGTCISCKDGTGTEVASSSDAGPLNVTVNEGDDIVCTITNTFTAQKGSITVEKVTDPSPDLTDTSFSFALGGAGSGSTSLKNGGSHTFTDLLPGTYTVTEAVPGAWTLTEATCDGAPYTNGDNIVLDAGENVTCTFTNTFLEPGNGPEPPAPPPAVGGEAYPVNKIAILAPWIAIAMAIIAGSFIVVRRRRSVRLLRR